jgi:hypothetical protein
MFRSATMQDSLPGLVSVQEMTLAPAGARSVRRDRRVGVNIDLRWGDAEVGLHVGSYSTAVEMGGAWRAGTGPISGMRPSIPGIAAGLSLVGGVASSAGPADRHLIGYR